MEAQQLQVWPGEHVRHRLFRLPTLDRQPELRVEDAGGRLDVRVRVDVGRDAHQHGLPFAQRPRDVVQQRELVEVVEHDAAHARRHRLAQLLGRLVVAVEERPFQREADGLRDGELAARDEVHPQPLLGHQRRQPAPKVGLCRVDDGALLVSRRERLAIGAASRAQLLLVEDVERRAELLRQIDGVAAAEGEVALRRHLRRAGQHGRQRGV